MNTPALRLVLTAAQSAVLDDHAADHFVMVHRPCRTEEPEIHQRWTITLCPVSTRTAKDIAAVLCGTATVNRNRKAATPATKPATDATP